MLSDPTLQHATESPPLPDARDPRPATSPPRDAPIGPTTELERSLLALLARVAEFRIDPGGTHAVRVGHLAADLALALEMDEAFCEMIRWAAPLHDLGTVGVPDHVLTHAPPLSGPDANVMKLHTSVIEVLLGREEGPALVEMIRRVAVGHHERWDGRGYPEGLRGASIPIEARIVAVADTYQSLTHRMPRADAMKEIMAEAGAAFDPQVVGALVRVAARAAA
ncbi:MAG: HD domain-containing protein [Gemmatimonadota bacterium]